MRIASLAEILATKTQRHKGFLTWFDGLLNVSADED